MNWRILLISLIYLTAIAGFSSSAFAVTVSANSNEKSKALKLAQKTVAKPTGKSAPAKAPNPDATQTTPTPPNSAELVTTSWDLGCKPLGKSNELACEASKRVALKQTGKVLLSVFITPRKQKDKSQSFLLRMQLPHGIHLPSGVEIQIDDADKYLLPFQTTNPAGIFARIALNDKILTALQTGKTMNVSFATINGAQFSIPVLLNGFSAIFAKMQ